MEKADQCVALYRQFLALTLSYPGKSIVPTKEIDAVWHAHILDTVKYREDCERIFGRFIHHFPYLGLRGPEDAECLQEAFAETRQLFKKHFGTDLMSDAQICTGNECGTQCDGSSWRDGAGHRDSRPRPVRPALV